MKRSLDLPTRAVIRQQRGLFMEIRLPLLGNEMLRFIFLICAFFCFFARLVFLIVFRKQLWGITKLRPLR